MASVAYMAVPVIFQSCIQSGHLTGGGSLRLLQMRFLLLLMVTEVGERVCIPR